MTGSEHCRQGRKCRNAQTAGGSTAAPDQARGGRPRDTWSLSRASGARPHACTPERVIEVLHGLVLRGAPRHRSPGFDPSDGERGAAALPRVARNVSHRTYGNLLAERGDAGGERDQAPTASCSAPSQTFGQASCGLPQPAVHSNDPLMGRGAKYLLGRRPFRVESESLCSPPGQAATMARGG